MKSVSIVIVLLLSVLASACSVEVFVQPATDAIYDVVVEDQGVPPEGAWVEVKTVGDTLVTWMYEGDAESETVSGMDVDEGEVWTVYAGYVEYW